MVRRETNMVSKKQAAFTHELRAQLTKHGYRQRDLAAYLRIAPSSVSRKMRGLHPWTAEEQNSLQTWLSFAVPVTEHRPRRDDDPKLAVMDQVLLDLPMSHRREWYPVAKSVLRGYKEHLTPYGQEQYRVFCSLVS